MLKEQDIYQDKNKKFRTNHEYNIIKLEGKWYPIDSTREQDIRMEMII